MNTAVAVLEEVVVDEVLEEDVSEVLDVRLHQINHELKRAVPIDVSSANPDLDSYLISLQKSIREQQEGRSYSFRSEETIFTAALDDFHMSETLEGRSQTLADRLLREEISTEESYGHLARGRDSLLNKGSFLQFLFKSHGRISYLGVKIEHETFLDENDLTKKSGLPEKSKIYKACVVNFDENGVKKEALVFETKKSKYWWDGFLELLMRLTDDENTKRAVKAVVGILDRSLKEDFPDDYRELRNIVVGAFKKKERMNYNKFIDDLFDTYEPISPELISVVPGVLRKMKEAPKKKGFDTQFDLIPGSVPYRQMTIKLTPEVELRYVEGMSNISDVIWSEETEDGKQLVVINSPTGFSKFEKKVRK